MSITKGKLITTAALAALGGVAALALAGQPGPSAAQSGVAAIDAAQPQVKREVVHRTRHVPAEPAASVPAPVSLGQPVGAADDSYGSGDDYGDDDEYGEYGESGESGESGDEESGDDEDGAAEVEHEEDD